MKKKIDEKYLNNAVDIRRTYITYMTKISEYESEIKVLLDKLLEIKNNLKNIDKNSKDIGKIQVEIALEVQKNIEKIQNLLLPYTEKILELENQSKILYDNIYIMYSDLTKEDIQTQVYEYVNNNV